MELTICDLTSTLAENESKLKGLPRSSDHSESPESAQRSDSRPVTPTPATPPVASTLSSGTLTVTPSSTVDHSPRVKLPKLSLKGSMETLPGGQHFGTHLNRLCTITLPLTSVDKLNYLNSLLESVAEGAVSALTLSAANYEEAITILK